MKNWMGILSHPLVGGSMRSGAAPALRLGGAFVQLLGAVLVSRSMGAEKAGDFLFWSLVLMTFGQISTFGLDRLLLRQLPRLEHQHELRSKLLAKTRASSMMMAGVFGLLLVLYAVYLQEGTDRPIWWYLLIPLATMGVALCMINGEAMIALGRPVIGVCFRHTMNTLLFVGGALVLAFMSRLSPHTALAAFTLALAGAGIGALFFPGFGGFRESLALPTAGEFLEFLQLGLPICLSSAFVGLSSVIPVAVVEQTHSPTQVAFLTTALRLFLLLEILASSFHAFNIPDLSRAAQGNDGPSLWRLYRSTLLTAVVIMLPVMLIMDVFAGQVMALFGKDFGMEASTILRVLIGFGVVSLLLGPSNHLMLMTGHTRRLAVISFLRMALTAILALLLVHRVGLVGMAVVFGAGLVIEKLCYLAITARSLRKRTEAKAESAAECLSLP